MKYYLETLLQLSLAKVWVCCIPCRFWSYRCGFYQAETLRKTVGNHRSIAPSIKRVARRLPWKSGCLDQAFAAQAMLARRGHDSTLYFGMRKRSEQHWEAHAWLRAGNVWVIGYEPDMKYTVVGTYAKCVK